MKNISSDSLKAIHPVKLKHIPTSIDIEATDHDAKHMLNEIREELSDIQDVMYAHNKYAVLICLQGMDTAGKDSLIREVFKEFNPRGVVVHSFKTPSKLELQHDFLWRHIVTLPQRGKFGVFNRTHYENVLVTRVHPQYILGENLPGIEALKDIDANFWNRRFEQINNFEKQIAANGTIIFKFFLHLGKEEQRQRLLRRLDKKKHNWKFSPGDLKERERWNDYQGYYEEAINKTSKSHAPWFIIPADNKATARMLVGKIILEEMKKYTDIQQPKLDEEIADNIKHYRDILSNEQ